MSTTYQILYADKNKDPDIENDYRFYKKREISKIPQSEWLYEIFKNSMNAKIKATRLFIAMFVLFSVIYYEIVTATASENKATLIELRGIRKQLVLASEEDEIINLLARSNQLYDQCKGDAERLYDAFKVIEILSFLNLTYMI